MKNSIHTNKYRAGRSTDRDATPAYSELVAQTLIAFAEHDAEFRNTLLALTAHLPTPEGAPAPLPDLATDILTPTHTEAATKRALWLLESDDLPDLSRAYEALAHWHAAQHELDPQAIVLGIKVGVLPIGIFGHHKLETQMPIIIRRDIYAGKSEKLGDMMVKSSTSVISQSIMLAGNDINKTEPEALDWFFGAKDTQIFTAMSSQMEKLISDLKRLRVAHSILSDEVGVAIIATSPVVHGPTLELEYDLKQLN